MDGHDSEVSSVAEGGFCELSTLLSLSTLLPSGSYSSRLISGLQGPGVAVLCSVAGVMAIARCFLLNPRMAR